MGIRGNSLRGVVLSYIMSEPGRETINTIAKDLNTDGEDRGKRYRAIFNAVENLEQRGFIKVGLGPNKSNSELWPDEMIFQESGVFKRHSECDLGGRAIQSNLPTAESLFR